MTFPPTGAGGDSGAPPCQLALGRGSGQGEAVQCVCSSQDSHDLHDLYCDLQFEPAAVNQKTALPARCGVSEALG